MDLFEASILAKELIGIYLPQFTFSYNSLKTVNGRCVHRTKTIELSRHLTSLRTREAVIQTIYHEIAHGLTPGSKHGKLWQQQMRRFGYVPERCSSDEVDKSSISNWKAVCPGCAKEVYMVRAPRVTRSCSKCSGKNYNPKYKLTFRRI